jgi:L-fucose mutarotase
MLKGIHPLLTADLLRALRAMGHGDELAVVDANFPAASLGPAAFTMAVVGNAAAVPEAVAEFAAVFTEHGLADCEIGQLERGAFYERTRRAFAIVRTGELRPYGNLLLVKGVLNHYVAPA